MASTAARTAKAAMYAALLVALLPCLAAVHSPAGNASCPASSTIGREGVCVPRHALLQVGQAHRKAVVLQTEEAWSSPGMMTMWSDSPTTLVGGSCEYANAANGGLTSPAATSPYVAALAYCAADDGLYAGGAACGNCYRVSYDGSPTTDPGHPGSLVVQIVDSGSAKTFDCQLTAFQAITGASTGVFPVDYEPVDCETAAGGAAATVLDGNNAWYTKVIFSNLPKAVVAARLAVGSKRFAMSRNSGATWKAQLDGSRGVASFEITLEGGSTLSLAPCFQTWPVSTGSSCSGAAAATAAPTPVASTSTAPPAAATTRPPQTWPGPWRPVDGGLGRACRGASAGDNSNSYYMLHMGVATIEACMALCNAEPSCTGLEHKAETGRCEVWTRAIESSKAVSGYTCLAGLWAPVGGGAGRACRGNASGDNSGAYYDLHTGVATLEDCKALCVDEGSCAGVEFRASTGRCELWSRDIGASVAVEGYECLRYFGGSPQPAECSDAGSNCEDTRCCKDAGLNCYRKDAYWASCRPSCTPGVYERDPPQYQTPWSCELLGGPGAASGASLLAASRPSPANASGLTLAAGSEWIAGTWTTGYWDCCKPSCSWPGKGRVDVPVAACSASTGQRLEDPGADSVCQGGPAASCTDNRPFVVSPSLSMGFAAAAVGGVSGLSGDDNCGQCFELRFEAARHAPAGDNWGGAHPEVVGRAMIVQVTNIGYDVNGEHSFDVQIPGAGQGIFTNGCTAQFPGYASADFDCNNNYGGCNDKSGCERLPPELRPGCEWRYDWLRWLAAGGQTNNPYVKFRRVKCPSQLISISGSTPLDDDAYPQINLADYP